MTRLEPGKSVGQRMAKLMVHSIPSGISTGGSVTICPHHDGIQVWELWTRDRTEKAADRAERDIQQFIADAIDSAVADALASRRPAPAVPIDAEKAGREVAERCGRECANDAVAAFLSFGQRGAIARTFTSWLRERGLGK